MPQEQYDIFINYRRSTGAEVARNIQLYLEGRGYRVFLDYDELRDGRFNQRIMDAIKSAPVFISVLSRNALDRCCDAQDWVRREIEYAIALGRQIIPVNPNDQFSDFPDDCPLIIREGLGQHQFSKIDTKSLFRESMNKLVDDRIAEVLGKRGGTTHTNRTEGAEIHIEADLVCRVLLFNKEIAVIRPGEDRVIRLKKGRNKLEFVSTECADDRWQVIQTVEDVNSVDMISVELLPMREQRKQAAAAERRRIEEEKRKAAEAAERKRREEEERRRRAAEEERRRREEEKRKAAEAAERQCLIGMFEMVKVAGGTFTMGASTSDSEADSDEKPAHRVTLSGYYIGKYEVTQKQWVEIMGSNPSYFKGDNLPVERVSWEDIQEFLRKLNAKTGMNYRLPTEAEWEFAARGGNSSRGYKYSGSDNIGNVAWYDGNSGSKTHPVGTKSPNELGIYDMTGNVWEWCQDRFDSNYYSNSPSSNPKGPSSGAIRVLRGGSWFNIARNCRVSRRFHYTPGSRDYYFGFRLAASL